MINSEYIYTLYKQIECTKKDKKQTISWSKFKSKASKDKLIKLETISNYFNTIWHNINIETYINIGFDLWKTFSIDKIDDKKIINKYKTLDKQNKRKVKISNDKIKRSIDFISNYNIPLNEYCCKPETISYVITDYLNNNIDVITLIYLIENGFKKINNIEHMLLSYLRDNYDEIKFNMYKKHKFIKQEFMNKKI